MSIGSRIFWKSRLFFLKEEFFVFRRFYLSSWRYLILDLALRCSYFFNNPYRICRRYFQRRGEENVHAYGETPLTLWAEIAKMAQITKEDRFVDLGCGRGRLCFWTSHWIGCPAIGIDWVPQFTQKSQRLSKFFHLYPTSLKNRIFGFAKALGIDNLKSTPISNMNRFKIVDPQELSLQPKTDFPGSLGIKPKTDFSITSGISALSFSNARITDADLKNATVIYMYTFHPDEETLDLAAIGAKTRVITVSEPIHQSGFKVQRSMSAVFPWGKTDVYVNVKL